MSSDVPRASPERHPPPSTVTRTNRRQVIPTDKDAFIIAHEGAAEHINDDTKSLMDRYSDMLYLAAAALGVIGSIFATIYAQITRVAPEKASELATAILLVGERTEHANSLDALEALQASVSPPRRWCRVSVP